MQPDFKEVKHLALNQGITSKSSVLTGIRKEMVMVHHKPVNFAQMTQPKEVKFIYFNNFYLKQSK